MTEAAIYHFTDGAERRPIVYQKDLLQLEEFARKQGYTATEVFLDKTLRKSHQTEFARFIGDADRFEALITKDFYHISKNTGRCFDILKEFADKGLTIRTMKDGSFQLEEPPMDKPLRVATYTCFFRKPETRERDIQLQNDIFRCFVERKTLWTVIDQYTDISLKQRDGEQEEMRLMVQHRDRYDLILTTKLVDIHWRTANFCKTRNELGKDIYALQDGFLPYERTA